MRKPETVKVLVNGISAKGGGGVSILSNFLRVAANSDDRYRYVAVVPDASDWSHLESARVSLVSAGYWSKNAVVPLASVAFLPWLARRLHCSVIFNLADVPIPTPRRQVFLFDWSYAAFPDSPAWSMANPKDRLVRKLKLLLFRLFVPFVDIMVAQTDILAARLKRLYGLERIEVVPNAVSIENLQGQSGHSFDLPSGFKFLCLTRYYSHKNLEIFLPVARLIKQQGIEAKIVTTLDIAESDGAARFLKAVDADGLSDVIINVGTVPMSEVPSLYMQADALLLPTLLESFSGTYVEAMYHGIPILTSDLDFAHGVCREGAFYFDPSDAGVIFETMEKAMSDPDLCALKVAHGKEILASMPDWDGAYARYASAFDRATAARQ